MTYDLELIKELFKDFWKKNKESFKYYIRGNNVEPNSIKISGPIQLIQGDFGKGYNFKVEIILVDVLLDGLEEKMKGELIIKVKVEMINKTPTEIIEDCKDNRVDLYSK